MADEQRPTEPKNQTRWSTKAMRWVFSLALPAVGGTYVYKQFIEEKPLYDTFMTRDSAQIVIGRIDQLSATVIANQAVQTSEIQSLRSEIKTFFEAQRTANEALHERQEAQSKQFAIDIANLKFIVTGKSN